MNTEGMIDVTGVNLVKLCQEAYALSRPQGLGYMHFQEGALPEDEARLIVGQFASDRHIALSLDYVKGRACKLTVRRDADSDKLYIGGQWFDHSDGALRELLSRVGVTESA